MGKDLLMQLDAPAFLDELFPFSCVPHLKLNTASEGFLSAFSNVKLNGMPRLFQSPRVLGRY
ncbi:hypothetical protein D3C75_1201450 [compost metagenome]